MGFRLCVYLCVRACMLRGYKWSKKQLPGPLRTIYKNPSSVNWFEAAWKRRVLYGFGWSPSFSIFRKLPSPKSIPFFFFFFQRVFLKNCHNIILSYYSTPEEGFFRELTLSLTPHPPLTVCKPFGNHHDTRGSRAGTPVRCGSQQGSHMHGVLLSFSVRTYLHERQCDLFCHKGYSRNFLWWGKNTHTWLLNVSSTTSLSLQEVFSAQTEAEGSSQFANLYFK